jgi:hypothetical protein
MPSWFFADRVGSGSFLGDRHAESGEQMFGDTTAYKDLLCGVSILLSWNAVFSGVEVVDRC